jgi:hypothetical protein
MDCLHSSNSERLAPWHTSSGQGDSFNDVTLLIKTFQCSYRLLRPFKKC